MRSLAVASGPRPSETDCKKIRVELASGTCCNDFPYVHMNSVHGNRDLLEFGKFII